MSAALRTLAPRLSASISSWSSARVTIEAYPVRRAGTPPGQIRGPAAGRCLASRSMTELSKRDDLPTEPDERSVLLTMLRYVRETVHFKCTDVSPADSVRAPLGTSPLMTVNGLVNHLVWVEKHWIEGVFLGRDIG